MLFGVLFIFFLQNISASQERSLMIRESWMSEGCQRFFNNSYFQTIEDVISCSHVQSTLLPIGKSCPQTRNTKWFSVLPGEGIMWSCKQAEVTQHRDVLVGKRDKIIFVNISKCASSTMRALLNDEFSISNDTDMEDIKNLEDLEEYFIFTFVRDPFKKLISSIEQAQKEGIRLGGMEILRAISIGCTVDKHVWSMARYLNVKDSNGKMIEYDFIGTLENIDEDLSFLLPILKAPPFKRREMLLLSLMNIREEEKKDNNKKIILNKREKNGFSLNYDDEDVRKKICLLVKHDYSCLGSQYRIPDFCL